MPAQASPNAIPRRTQAPCCYTSAMASDATYCAECGKPLLRCMAVEECCGLLDDQGLCTVCVAPHLQISAGAVIDAKVGGALALPVSITNQSVVGRPLYVTKIMSREASGEWREEALGWERLDAGQSRPVVVTASKLDRSGAHSIEIMIVVSSRWRWRKERYAFVAALQLSVEDEASKNGPVVTIGGESAGHGNTVYISDQSGASTKSNATKEAITLELVRAEKEERNLGLRGLDQARWVPKDTKVIWRGFLDQDIMPDGPILTADGIVAVGRARSRRSGGLGDVRLLVEDADGNLDEQLSRRISRRHFELYVECNRLVLRVTGSGGVRINGTANGPGKEIVLADKDRIEPLVSVANSMALIVNFRMEHGAVTDVTITRDPSSRKGD